MDYQSDDIQVSGLDTKALSSLIIELNIARRNCRAYPKGHPVISASFTKALRAYDDLMMLQDEIILGVTSSALMVAGVFLDKTNLVYRDFARVLFDHGIGALLLHSGLTLEELDRFTTILSLRRDDILCQGGIEQLWSDSGIQAIGIRSIRYDLFSTTDEDSINSERTIRMGESLWERFARGLTRGELSSDGSTDVDLDPHILADVLNRQFDQNGPNEVSYSQTITSFMRQGDTAASPGYLKTVPYEKLATFISGLNPELRRQFLSSSFEVRNSAGQIATEKIISNLSSAAVLETLDDVNQHRLSVPPIVMGLLQRMGRHGYHQQNIEQDISSEENIAEKMKTIFREHDSEEFVPDEYQQKLNAIIAADHLPRMQVDDSGSLLETLENQHIEASIGEILLNLVREGCETLEEREMLVRNLSDMFRYVLQTGEYEQLHTMVDRTADATFPASLRTLLSDEYSCRENLEEILDGLAIWGKPRYEDIRRLILKMGPIFCEVLLDRLSEETNMSMRRFFMDCLIALGPEARVAVAGRLGDSRWYYLRNLLIILCAINQPDVVPQIRPLLRNPDPRLHQEVLKVLVHFGDPIAEKQVVQNLESQDQERLLETIKLTERCSSPAILTALIGLLSKGGLQQSEYLIKKAVVDSLAESGRTEALPELARILSSRSLLHATTLTRLKIDIVQSFERYPLKIARPILERLAGDSGDIARQATLSLQKLTGAMP
ncbi:MAG TPA: HEAT repeat domain-containing protein [Desulfuromonadales bacterium]|nr:HEAT repeat domain-containing protein [Desulfuromonadales bacterium]